MVVQSRRCQGRLQEAGKLLCCSAGKFHIWIGGLLQSHTRRGHIHHIRAAHITIYILATQAEQAKASTKTSDSAAPAAIKDGDYVTLSATYKEVDDAQEGPLQPGQYGIVVGGGGSLRVNVSARARVGYKAVSWRSTIAANAVPDTCALLLQSSLP